MTGAEPAQPILGYVLLVLFVAVMALIAVASCWRHHVACRPDLAHGTDSTHYCRLCDTMADVEPPACKQCGAKMEPIIRGQ